MNGTIVSPYSSFFSSHSINNINTVSSSSSSSSSSSCSSSSSTSSTPSTFLPSPPSSHRISISSVGQSKPISQMKARHSTSSQAATKLSSHHTHHHHYHHYHHYQPPPPPVGPPPPLPYEASIYTMCSTPSISALLSAENVPIAQPLPFHASIYAKQNQQQIQIQQNKSNITLPRTSSTSLYLPSCLIQPLTPLPNLPSLPIVETGRGLRDEFTPIQETSSNINNNPTVVHTLINTQFYQPLFSPSIDCISPRSSVESSSIPNASTTTSLSTESTSRSTVSFLALNDETFPVLPHDRTSRVDCESDYIFNLSNDVNDPLAPLSQNNSSFAFDQLAYRDTVLSPSSYAEPPSPIFSSNTSVACTRTLQTQSVEADVAFSFPSLDTTGIPTIIMDDTSQCLTSNLMSSTPKLSFQSPIPTLSTSITSNNSHDHHFYHNHSYLNNNFDALPSPSALAPLVLCPPQPLPFRASIYASDNQKIKNSTSIKSQRKRKEKSETSVSSIYEDMTKSPSISEYHTDDVSRIGNVSTAPSTTIRGQTDLQENSILSVTRNTSVSQIDVSVSGNYRDDSTIDRPRKRKCRTKTASSVLALREFVKHFIEEKSHLLINKDLKTISEMLRNEYELQQKMKIESSPNANPISSNYQVKQEVFEVETEKSSSSKRTNKFCRTFIQKIARGMGFILTKNYGLVHESLKKCMKIRKRGDAIFKKKRFLVNDTESQIEKIQAVLAKTSDQIIYDNHNNSTNNNNNNITM